MRDAGLRGAGKGLRERLVCWVRGYEGAGVSEGPIRSDGRWDK